MILDVGSGRNPLFSEKYEVVHVDVVDGVHLEVKCDAHYLPFKDRCFKVVHASHVLEHAENPLNVLKEFKRLSKGFVVIKVPNALNYGRFAEPNHYYSWTWCTLENLLRIVFNFVSIAPTIRVETSHKLIPKLIKKVKVAILATLFGKNELTAICR